MKIKIIGCGTAGLAYGITTLRLHPDWQVDIYEKRDRWHEKACGGICPDKTVKLLEKLSPSITSYPTVAFDPVHWIRYNSFTVMDYIKDNSIKKVITGKLNNRILRAPKIQILENLRGQFLTLGGKIYYEKLEKIEKDEKYDKTVNCSGADLTRKDNGFAIESKPFKYDNSKTQYSDANILYDDYIRGYFWIMNCGEDGWNVGVIGERNFEEYNDMLREFAKKTMGQEKIDCYGAYTTYKFNKETTNGLENIGESAGLTTPIGFEGIYRSLKCGIDMATNGTYDYAADKKDNEIGNKLSNFIYACVGKVLLCTKIFHKGQKELEALMNEILCNQGLYYKDKSIYKIVFGKWFSGKR